MCRFLKNCLMIYLCQNMLWIKRKKNSFVWSQPLHFYWYAPHTACNTTKVWEYNSFLLSATPFSYIYTRGANNFTCAIKVLNLWPEISRTFVTYQITSVRISVMYVTMLHLSLPSYGLIVPSLKDTSKHSFGNNWPQSFLYSI